jgi:N-acetylmuramoyl-L-alanine amidase
MVCREGTSTDVPSGVVRWLSRIGVVLLVLVGALTMATASRSSIRWSSNPPEAATDAVGAVRTGSGVVAPVLAAFDGGWWVRTPCYRVQRVFVASPVEDVDVVIDPGHGGMEDGAPGVDGIKEKVVNIAVARLVAVKLRANGRHVVLTHERDDYLTLHTRGEIATSIDPELMVSIHHNSVVSTPSPHPGTEAIHQFRSTRSRLLAEALFTDVRTGIGRFDVPWVGSPDAKPNIRMGDDGDYYGILRYSGGVPTAIIEAGYIDNPPEARLFMRPDYQDVEASAIAGAIERTLHEYHRRDLGAEPTVRPAPGTPAEDAEGCVDPPLDTAQEGSN